LRGDTREQVVPACAQEMGAWPGRLEWGKAGTWGLDGARGASGTVYRYRRERRLD